MAGNSDKLQIGIRLSAALAQRIDAKRHTKTRAEFCRELIEAGLAAIEHGPGPGTDLLSEAVDSLQREVLDTHRAAIVAERDAGSAVAEIKRLRSDCATAIAAILTKLGQVVREEDQRKFAREKAEQFAKRVFFSQHSEQEEDP